MEARAEFVACVAVECNGNNLFAIDALQVFDGEDAARTVGATLTGEFLKQNLVVGLEGEVFDRRSESGRLVVEFYFEREAVLNAFAKSKLFGECERICILILKCETALFDVVDDFAVAIFEGQFDRAIGFKFAGDVDVAFDYNRLAVDKSLGDIERCDKFGVAQHCDVVDKYNALVVIVVDKGDVDVLTGKFGEIDNVVTPLALKFLFVGTWTLEFVVDELALSAEPFYD